MIIIIREVVENDEFLSLTSKDLEQNHINSSNCLEIRAFVKTYNCVELLSSSEAYNKQNFFHDNHN